VNLLVNKKIAIAATCIWAAIVFCLHVMRIDVEGTQNVVIPHADKVVHFTMFALLAYLMIHALKLRAKEMGRAMMLVFFICMAYGAGLEYIQGAWFAGRDCDPLDWFADMVGTLAALFLARVRAIKSGT
jgi:VanZ family protein